MSALGTVTFTVQEAYDKDAGRGIARVDQKIMYSLTASPGDVIEIRGKRRTVAKCLPLYPSDEGKGIIRVDGLVRNNSGVAIGDTVVVRKIKAIPAEKVIVAPLEAIPPIDERYLADALESVPLIKGDNVMVPYFGGRLTFQVIGVTPSPGTEQAPIINRNTIFQITAAPQFLPTKPTEITHRIWSISRSGSVEDVDLFSTLERLANLRQKGIVTEEEFENIKLQILGKISQQVRNKSTNTGRIDSATTENTEEITSDQLVSNQDLVYENAKYGIKLKYPSSCEGLEFDSSPVNGVTRIIQFIWSSKKAILTIDISNIPYGSESLDAYSRGRVFRLRKIYPNIEIIESGPTILAGLDGHKIVFTYSNNLYKVMQVWITINNNACIISYSALAKDNYEKNLTIAEDMIQSIEITSNKVVKDNGQKELEKGLYSYSNEYHNISVQYPIEWIVDERAHSKDREHASQIVAFLSPSKSNPEILEDRLVIGYEKINSATHSLDKLTTSYIIGLANQYHKLNFTIVEVSSFLIANISARKVVYTTSSGGIENEIRTMEILAIKDDRWYTITFGAQSHEFSDYMPVVEKMMDSLVIQTQKQQTSDVMINASDNLGASSAELLVLLDLTHKNIDRGEDQTITISVVNKSTSSVVHDAVVRGEVFTPSSQFMTLEEKSTGQDGKAVYSWSVDNNAETGEFTVIIRVSADSYEPKSLSETYKVRPKNRAPI